MEKFIRKAQQSLICTVTDYQALNHCLTVFPLNKLEGEVLLLA